MRLYRHIWLLGFVGSVGLSPGAQAQQTETLKNSQRFLPKGTPVTVELVDALSSERVSDGDHFAIRVSEPVMINGETLVPAGALGEGEVIHAARAQGFGMPGELIVSVRFVRCGATAIPIGHLQFSSSGRDRTMAWIVERSIFRYPQRVSGNFSELPAGSHGTAKVSADTLLPSAAVCSPVPAPTGQGRTN